MEYFLRCGDVRVSLEGVEWMEDDVDFNPFPFGERVVGFVLKGEKVVPLIDAGTSGRNVIYIHTGRSVVLIRYDSVEKGRGELSVREIEEEVLKELGGL